MLVAVLLCHLRNCVDDFLFFFIVITNAEAEYNFCFPLLIMDNGIVLGEDNVVFKHKHLTLLELTDVMVLPIVFPQHVLVTVHLILRQVRVLFLRLNFASKLAADVAEVVLASIMHVQLILIVKVPRGAKIAVRVLLVDVLVKRVKLVVRLFKD